MKDDVRNNQRTDLEGRRLGLSEGAVTAYAWGERNKLGNVRTYGAFVLLVTKWEVLAIVVVHCRGSAR